MPENGRAGMQSGGVEMGERGRSWKLCQRPEPNRENDKSLWAGEGAGESDIGDTGDTDGQHTRR